MELTREKNIKVAVQLNGESYITTLEGLLYQKIEDDKAFFMIKSQNGEKEIKIEIVKDVDN